MAYAITKDQRQALRTSMRDHTTFVSLEIIVSDTFENIQLDKIVRGASDFETQCYDLIVWAQKEGQIDALCRALQGHEKTRGNAKLRQVVDGILAALIALPAAPPPAGSVAAPKVRTLILNRRPFLNRKDLWDKLDVFATASELDRLLLIKGETATGKTYSEYLIANRAASAGAAFVSIGVQPATEGEVEAAALARTIASRFGPERPNDRFDDLAQAARDGRSSGDALVGRLAKLPDPTWLLIDGLNEADLAESAEDLLIRLCRAVDTRECTNLWLILVGHEASRLGAQFETLITWEQACPPEAEDIAEFITMVATKAGKKIAKRKLDAYVAELLATLGAPPTHEGWRVFHLRLAAICDEIRKGP